MKEQNLKFRGRQQKHRTLNIEHRTPNETQALAATSAQEGLGVRVRNT